MACITTKEMFNVSTKAPEYGIPGYYVAKTTNYSSRESKFSKDSRKDLSYESRNHSKEPDPTRYSETYEKSASRYWTSPNGKFLKAKKQSVMEETANKTKDTPGPGAYMKEESRPNSVSVSFSKCERSSYLDSVEWYANETPCSWKYSPSLAAGPKKKGWVRPSSAKPASKDPNGPGKYADGLDNAYKKTQSSVISHSFTRCRDSNGSIYEKVAQTKYVPGVGSYKDADKAYSGYKVVKRPRAAIIMPYKYKGFTDDLIKRSKETPGPGSYYIGPPIKQKK